MMTKIQQIFSAENFNDPRKLDWVRQEASYLLRIMEADPNFSLEERFGRSVSPASLERFFRRRERQETTCRTMRYLLTFLSHVPTGSDVQGQPVNPAAQFRDFLLFQADLLLEEDVKNAVFLETNQGNHCPAGTVWNIQDNILVMNRKLRNMLAKDEANLAAWISNLCRVLEHLCLFWFDIRRHDIRRTRRSDIFMYLLAQLVRGRCWQVAAPHTQ